MSKSNVRAFALGVAALLLGGAAPASAQEIIKLGLSVQLSGPAAVWGQGAEFMCKKAASEIAEAGGVTVGDKKYNFECVAYDNKYTAAEGTRVAQALLNREGVKFIGGSLGTAPVQALQALTERQGVLLFTSAWGSSIKGPNYPMTFTQLNTPNEILPSLISYVTEHNPDARSVLILNPNDASGQETVKVAERVWKEKGIEILAMDFYERGTTEFQPIAARIASLNPDIADLGTLPPSDAGAVFRELDVLGWKGTKVVAVGTGADALRATGGSAVEGVYMGLAITFDGDDVTEHQNAVNQEARALLGESLNTIHIAYYDTVYALKTGIEAAQSVDPKEVAKALPGVRFTSFYGGEIGFGGTEIYGSPQQMQAPVLVTQIQDGKLVELSRIAPKGN